MGARIAFLNVGTIFTVFGTILVAGKLPANYNQWRLFEM
jgi:hypothetical protein